MLWDVEGEIEGEIDGRRDIQGGRLSSSRKTTENAESGCCFNSVCYTADGSCLIAGGKSKFVCIYELSQRMLLKRFQISYNRSMDGVLSQLNSKNMTEAGPMDSLDVVANDSDDDQAREDGWRNLLPGAKRGADPGARAKQQQVSVACVRFSPTGRAWAAASTEGLLVYALDDDLIFDPFELDVDVTPAAVRGCVAAKEYGRALLMALQLNEQELVQEACEAVPMADIALVARAMSGAHLQKLLAFLARRLAASTHLEYHLRWVRELLQAHGGALSMGEKVAPPPLMATFRALAKSLLKHQEDLGPLCHENQYTLDFLCSGVKVAPPEEVEDEEEDLEL